MQGKPVHGWEKTKLLWWAVVPRHTSEAQNGVVPIFNSAVVEGHEPFLGVREVYEVLGV